MDNKLLLVIIAFFIPPLAVFLMRGIGMSLLISIILSMMFWVPGQIYALWILFKGE